jgi:hypothetical protein
MTKNGERLSIFKRKILRRSCTTICKRGQRQKRYNKELEQLYNKLNIVNIIKSSRMRWTDHIV